MEFRRAKKEDLKDIMDIIKEGQEYFKSQGIPQWLNGYPGEDTILEDMKNQYSYVLEDDGRILGTAALIYGGEPSYKKIYEGEWLVKNLDTYATLHRVAVASQEKGKGLGGRILSFVEEDAINRGMVSVRIDTHRKNKSMKQLLEKNGFKYCGIIYLSDGGERIGFEKILDI